MEEGRLLAGRVVIVTGAGQGLGRSHALALAAEGARVVVNDIGADPYGAGRSPQPAREVTDAIRRAGGEAVADFEDVSSFAGAARLVEAALAVFGRLDAVVNNAGIVRSESFVRLSEADWHDVLAAHLFGHAGVSAAAARHWNELAQKEGPQDWRVVNTTSPVGLAGRAGSAAYVAAKGAIAALTAAQSDELCRYGVTVNAIAPAARTRLTEAVAGSPGEGFDRLDPANVSPLVAWLCSVHSRGVTGRIFQVEGGRLSLMGGWYRAAVFEQEGRLRPTELGAVLDDLIAHAPSFEGFLPGLSEAPLPEEGA